MLRQNVSYALRLLKRSPGFTATAILTLALGIGANTAIFSVLNAVLLRPLPFARPDALLWGWGKTTGSEIAALSPPAFRDYRERNRSFDQFAAIEVFLSHTALTGGPRPEQVRMGTVSANFFEVLGLAPLAGRGFIAADEQQRLPQVVLLGRGFWLQHFGGAASIIGATVTLDGNPVTVAGVVPDVPLLLDAQVWVPTPMLNPGMNERRSHFMMVLARLKRGVTREQAQSDLDGIAGQLAAQYPESDKTWFIRLQPLSEKLFGKVQQALMLLWCAVGLVLLIACGNVANLLLVRAQGREKEIAIRSALGASRAALIRGFLAESLTLSLAGGALAALLAMWGADALRMWGPADLPRLNELRVDGVVLAFALLLSIATGLLFGLTPALHISRGDLQTPLTAASHGNTRGKAGRAAGALIVTELAVSVVLLLSAGLALKNLWNLVHIDPGFEPAHTVTTAVGFAQTTRDRPDLRSAFVQRLLDGLKAIPGVESVGAVSELPLRGEENDSVFQVEGKIYPSGRGPGSRDVSIAHRVAGDYFEAMGIRLMAGRFLGDHDVASSQPVVVISEPFALQFFPGQNPVGRHILSDEGGNQGVVVSREVVGVAGGVRFTSLEGRSFPELYFPFAQNSYPSMNIVVRSSRDAGIGNAIRTAITAADPQQAVSEIRSMTEIVVQASSRPRFYSFLLGLFALVAITLSAVGLYGVISYGVSRRTREIGIRMALGASAGEIARMIGGEGLRLIALGLAIGLAGAWFASRLLTRFLFLVMPHDTAVFLILPGVLAAVALCACFLPIRRAMRVDPSVSLREP